MRGSSATLILAALLIPATAVTAAEPLRLHPDNPHYFLFRGKPTVLVTSGEHYGAVINKAFDFVTYLKVLQRNHLNNTRIWVGPYREVKGNFSIAENTLAPEPANFITPWPRTNTPGAGDGLNKFDLSQWNQPYFDRLRRFMQEASNRGVVVEVNLFCPYYEDSMWDVSPFNSKNNVNNIGDIPRTEPLTLKHPDLLKYQEEMVRKLVSELKDFDNFYFEICNEPYFGGVTIEWQKHISEVIHEADNGAHLISRNVGNGSERIGDPFELVSIDNFHYSRPPESVGMNLDLKRAIGNNETGFDGSEDATYRIQGWDFLMAGGALYNNLDYSFTVGHERGDFQYPPTIPGGGSETLRTELRYLHDFFDGMPFIKMSPAPALIQSGLPEGASARALAARGSVYAVYIHHGFVVPKGKPQYQVHKERQLLKLTLELPAAPYEMSWLDTKSGKIAKREMVKHPGGALVLASPEYTEDIALKIVDRTPGRVH